MVISNRHIIALLARPHGGNTGLPSYQRVSHNLISGSRSISLSLISHLCEGSAVFTGVLLSWEDGVLTNPL